MKIGIYAGSFDPVTMGHLDIIQRAEKIVDYLIVAVLKNRAKKALFSSDERVSILKAVIKEQENIEVTEFDGLLVEFAKIRQANLLIRGLRAATDFEYELQLAQINHKLYTPIDTVFLATSAEYAYVSSSVVKEIASYHGDITAFVPPQVIPFMERKYREKEGEKNGRK